MTQTSGWGAPQPSTEIKQVENVQVSDTVKTNETLVSLTRVLPEGVSGPTKADVHESQVSEWLQAGWVKA